MDCSPPGSSVHGIFQARIPEWVALSSSRGSSKHRDLNTMSLRSPILETTSAAGKLLTGGSVQFSSIQSLSCVWLFATPWTAACQTSLSITNSWSLLKLMSMSWWCHPTILSSVVPPSSCLQSLSALESYPVSQFFTWGGQSIVFQLQHQSFQWTLRTDLL